MRVFFMRVLKGHWKMQLVAMVLLLACSGAYGQEQAAAGAIVVSLGKD